MPSSVQSPTQSPAVSVASSAPPQYLTFLLDGETMGLGILRILEIIEVPPLTVVPMMPPFVRGVLNLRGAVVPVIDLKARFGRGPATISRRSCVVIIELRSDDDKQDIGILVDQVSQVVEISRDDIAPPPGFGAGLRPDFISGMGKLGSGFVVLLNLDNLLCVDELARAAAAAVATEMAADAPDEAPSGPAA